MESVIDKKITQKGFQGREISIYAHGIYGRYQLSGTGSVNGEEGKHALGEVKLGLLFKEKRKNDPSICKENQPVGPEGRGQLDPATDGGAIATSKNCDTQVQTESAAYDRSRIKLDLMQIPVSHNDTPEVQQKLMVGSRGHGMPVQAKLAIG
ncbi:MAG: hypothetical protein GDA56_26760 [Hormoscilla sp. GM7CHS1pb]|nr:hypothetical protein [Hormoscilla sp. GM7CHS1pb]